MSANELGDAGSGASGDRQIVSSRTKKALVGAGARILFYPTLVYNVVRNKMQADFRWWDEIDQFVLLGAVPFPKHVPRLREIGVGGVVTLNEPYETLVTSKLYEAHGIDHLVIPTRDYLFAPSLANIRLAVDFIQNNASSGTMTYVHCKAGRGRSATVVLCYLIKHKNMTPLEALEYVRSRRPRVLLAPAQWQAVQEFSRGKFDLSASQSSDMSNGVLVTEDDIKGYYDVDDKFRRSSSCSARAGGEALATADDLADSYIMAGGFEWIPRHSLSCPAGSDAVLVTEADFEGYEEFMDNCNEKSKAPNQNKITGTVMRKLSCLFCYFMSFAGSQSVASGILAVCAF